ncbi:MAG: hypothetical protein ABII13_01690 [Patescibacteria group bacterium]|nr:hypothetical protein [Patescibacteria group bacterium]MBU2509400.1 hypothetical protein [Patescibacteria group bacterium]
MQKNERLIILLAGIVTIVGLLVMLGWFLDVPLLKSILPQWVTMKFSTALAFALSGITLYLIFLCKRNSETAHVLLPLSSLFILLLMLVLFLSVVFGIKSGIEDLFVREDAGAVYTTVPGRPSIGTMIDFILIALLGLTAVFKVKRHRMFLRWGGGAISVIGVIAILGYVFNVPELYYTVENVSTAMALHTAILFVLIGLDLVLLGIDSGQINQNTQKI